ncbi:MAG: hypothetical protein WDW36_006051 [Sanguina aurantia]
MHLAGLAVQRGARLLTAASANDEEGEDEIPVPGKAMRVERLMANLGYGKRKECSALVQRSRVTTRAGEKLKVGAKVFHHDLLLDGEELDPAWPMVIAVHKPVGYVVTAPDDDKILDPKVYDLLPYRYGRRRPFLSCVGRLDKDTSGLILLTDDGQLLHRINSPKKGIWKVYEVTLADPLTVKEADAAAKRFESGNMLLVGEYTPLLPAKLVVVNERTARVAICEGRYHQIRRMFGMLGHEVATLNRISVGGITLDSLPHSEYRVLTAEEALRVFEGPSSEEVLAMSSGISSLTLSEHSSASSSSSTSSSSSSSSSSATDTTREAAALSGRMRRRQEKAAADSESESADNASEVVPRRRRAVRSSVSSSEVDAESAEGRDGAELAVGMKGREAREPREPRIGGRRKASMGQARQQGSSAVEALEDAFGDVAEAGESSGAAGGGVSGGLQGAAIKDMLLQVARGTSKRESDVAKLQRRRDEIRQSLPKPL